MSTKHKPIVLETASGVKVKLPGGIGLTPTFWKTRNKEYKKTIADHFNCDTIGQFEEDILNVGHAMMESDLTDMPHTQSDVAIATALGALEEMENSATDTHVAKSADTDETGLVTFTLAPLL